MSVPFYAFAFDKSVRPVSFFQRAVIEVLAWVATAGQIDRHVLFLKLDLCLEASFVHQLLLRTIFNVLRRLSHDTPSVEKGPPERSG